MHQLILDTATFPYIHKNSPCAVLFFLLFFFSHPQLACLQFNEVNLSVTKPAQKKTALSHLPACPSAAWSANRDRYHQTSGGPPGPVP